MNAWNLVRKDLILILNSHATWWILGTYWIILAVFKAPFQTKGLPEVANILVAFVVTAVLGAIGEAAEVRHRTEILYLSLPIRRRTMVLGGILSTVMVIILGVFYTFIATALIDRLAPSGLLVGAGVMRWQEMLFVFAMVLFAALSSAPLHYRYGSLSQKKLLNLFVISTVMLICFGAIPWLLDHLFGVTPSLADFRTYGPFAPAVLAIEVLGQGRALFIICLAGLAMVGASLALSIHFFERRDL